MRIRLVAGACALMFLLAGCGDGDPEERGARAPGPDATPGSAPCILDDASTDAKGSENDPPLSLVTDVRYSDEGCPRVVFEFEDQTAGYEVSYTEPPFTECGSGDAVPTESWDASAFLSVRLEPAASADIARGARPTYTGPRDISVGGRVLKHLRVVCDYEAVFEWIIGLDQRHAFSVVALEDDPPRLVVDISEGT